MHQCPITALPPDLTATSRIIFALHKLTCAARGYLEADVVQVGVAVLEPVLGQQLSDDLAARGGVLDAHGAVLEVGPDAARVQPQRGLQADGTAVMTGTGSDEACQATRCRDKHRDDLVEWALFLSFSAAMCLHRVRVCKKHGHLSDELHSP